MISTHHIRTVGAALVAGVALTVLTPAAAAHDVPEATPVVMEGLRFCMTQHGYTDPGGAYGLTVSQWQMALEEMTTPTERWRVWTPFKPHDAPTWVQDNVAAHLWGWDHHLWPDVCTDFAIEQEILWPDKRVSPLSVRQHIPEYVPIPIFTG